MRNLGKISWVLVLAVLMTTGSLIGPVHVAQASAGGSFSVLTYNVAGLPDFLSDSNPEVNTPKISPLLNDYDIVNVQEDFEYHDELIQHVTHPYLSETSGSVMVGSGLNRMSGFPFTEFTRITWNVSHGVFDDGSDELTPKGFTVARHQLEPGVFVDVYNLHADAGSDEDSLAARRDNLRQLYGYIHEYSEGNAVIVMGDTNCRYTRSGDIMEELLEEADLTDVWIELVRNGEIPPDGEALMDESDKNGPNFEVVDKILYRSSEAVTLTPVSYRVEHDKFVDENGEPLSDHEPISAVFEYSVSDQVMLSDSFGGTGGTPFNHLNDLPLQAMPVELVMQSGARLDGLQVAYADGTVLASGGTANEQTLTLADGEYIQEVTVHRGVRNGGYRIFYAEIRTSFGNVITGGTPTDESRTFTAPEGWYIAGFHGRAGDEIDRLGVIYKPLP